MPDIVEDRHLPWSNYHLTIGDQADPETLAAYMVIDHAAHYANTAGDGGSAIAKFAVSANIIKDYLGDCVARMADAPLTSFGVTGKSWSFAELIGSSNWQFDASGLSGCSEADTADLHQQCPIDPRYLGFVSGGTTLRAIANWAKARGLMIANSGTHLGPSIAGGYGTASHGSRLGEGGLQEMVLGVHLITGPNSSVWLERADRPILSEAAIAGLGATPVRDNVMFEDALIHLGGMGIVNGVAIELVENQLYYEARADVALGGDWDARIAQGHYQEISDSIMQGYCPELVGKAPVFYEITFNPHDYKGDSTLHIFYYDAPLGLMPGVQGSVPIRSGDGVVGYLQQFVDNPALIQMFQPVLWGAGEPPENWPPEFPRNAFLYYRGAGKFATQKPAGELVPLDWSQLHGDEITTGKPGALYNASFAVPRAKLPEALEAITQAVINAQLPPTFIFTARFVTDAAGTLAFTRFADSAVIEIDGASPWILALLAKMHEDFAQTANQMASAVRDGAMIVRDALETAGIDYSMHWAKLGELDAAKTERDFGPSANPTSPLARWRITREKLLTPAMRNIFWNEALVRYGVVDQPPPVTS